MTVRKTETRIPANSQPGDLGQSVATPDGRCVLVSFVTAPVVVGRASTYVLFVTDAGLAADAYEWTFQENGDVAQTVTTPHGETVYTPGAVGQLSLTVRVLDAGQAEQARLTLDQPVVLPSAELEALIAQMRDKPGPGAGDPEVLRELVNEHSRYYQAVQLKTPETGDAFQRFTFGVVFNGALQHTASQRRDHAAALAAALDDGGAAFPHLAAQGVGVSGIRLALLAMTVPKTPGGVDPYLPWRELPEDANQRAVEEEQLRADLGALDEAARLDLFNLARFPKSNITWCGRILETLRDRYLPGKTFDDVQTRLSGTLAHWLMRHYQEGPIHRA